MIEREYATVLARVPIAQQDVLARECACLMWNAAILKKPDHGWNSHGDTSGMQEVSVFFLGHSDTLKHQHNRPACGTDVDRLVGRIEHKDRLVQGVRIAVLVDARGEQAGRNLRPASGEIVHAQRHNY